MGLACRMHVHLSSDRCCLHYDHRFPEAQKFDHLMQIKAASTFPQTCLAFSIASRARNRKMCTGTLCFACNSSHACSAAARAGPLADAGLSSELRVQLCCSLYPGALMSKVENDLQFICNWSPLQANFSHMKHAYCHFIQGR